MTDGEGDTPELDLTPQEATQGGGLASRRWITAIVAAALVLAFGFLALKGLTEATVFFRNADEAVAERDELGDDRFRLQGTVLAGTVEDVGTGVAFEVVFNGVSVDVVHTGVPPELFQENIPVVLEGHWDGDLYRSDEMFVKHDEVYVEENGDRLDEADQQGSDIPAESP
jgi:cytochrome c-type biogenesis protein CcmE